VNCALVLAAGSSTRMGTQKVLLPWGSTTVIGHIVDVLGRCALDDIVVVVGHEGARVVEALSGRPVRIVENPRHADGMLSSIRCGLRALPESCEAVLVALGDQPGVREEVVQSVLEAFAGTGKGIIVPVHRGRRGHPLLFAYRYAVEVLSRHDDVGLRGLLADHPGDVLELPASSASVNSDMDTPEDYLRELTSQDDAGNEVRGPPNHRY
jgi:molybdenum cofactor cytidylyltransferase